MSPPPKDSSSKRRNNEGFSIFIYSRFDSEKTPYLRMKDIEIAKILYLAKSKKYEVACASFDVVDHLFKLDVPKNLKRRKSAVQTLSLLADEQVKYGYDKRAAVAVAEDDEDETT